MFSKIDDFEKYKFEFREALKEIGCEVNKPAIIHNKKDVREFSEMCRQVSEELTLYYPRIRVEILAQGCNIHLGRDSLSSPYWEKILFGHHGGTSFHAHHYKCENESPRYNVTSDSMPIQEIVEPLNRKGVNCEFIEFDSFLSVKSYLMANVAGYIKQHE